ncbi:MAG: hypothetical protein ACM3Z4_10385 [Hyphomicrobiales bacterium]
MKTHVVTLTAAIVAAGAGAAYAASETNSRLLCVVVELKTPRR